VTGYYRVTLLRVVADSESDAGSRSEHWHAPNEDCQLMASKFEYAAAYKLESESAHGSDSESC
jgi:hypothetical protein